MEKSVTWQFDTLLRETFQLPEGKPGEYSPLVLAYLGDAIYDLIIRTLVVGDGNRQVKKLHKATSALVQASAQSRMMEAIEELLTEEEVELLTTPLDQAGYFDIAPLDKGENLRRDVCLALEEMAGNIIRYGYDVPGERVIEIGIGFDASEVTLTLRDDGKPFNPMTADPPPTGDVEERDIGGVGVYLVRSMVRSMEYRREEGRNVLTLRIGRGE